MATRSRRVLIFRAQLTFVDTSKPGGNTDEASDVKAIMLRLKNLPWDRTKTENVYMEKGGMVYALRIDELDEEQNIVKGQFAAIDKDMLPEYELNGVVNSVELPTDAGIYYPFHFICYLREKHFALEYNRSAPRLELLQKYLEEKMKDSGLLNTAFFYQVFREDPFEAIEKMGSIAEIAIEVEKSKIDAFRNSPYETVLSGLSDIAPERATIKLGLSREKGARSGEAIDKVRFLRWARRRSSTRNEGVKVQARVEEQADDSGTSIWLDVFAQKYASKINVKVNRNKTVNSADCYEQIHLTYSRMMNS